MSETGFGPGASGTGIAQVPGVPIFSTSEQFIVTTASNDILRISYNGGAVTSVTLDAGAYDYTAMAAEIETQLDSTFTITSTVEFNDPTETKETKFTLDATSGQTFAFTLASSTAATLLGFDDDIAAAQTITSQNFVHGSNSITFTVATNGNGAAIDYAIFNITDDKYLGLDGIAQGATGEGGGGEIWDTIANWSNGGASGTITFSPGIAETDYTFKAKARSETPTETAFSAASSVMNVFPNLDFSENSEEHIREIPTGDTKIINASTTSTDFINSSTVNPAVTGTSGAILTTIVLQNCDAVVSSLSFEFSENSGSSYSTATDFFVITSANKVLTMASDVSGGDTDITIAEATYATSTLLADAIATAMIANTTLTNSGAFTPTCVYSIVTGLYTFATGSANTLSINRFSSTNTAGYTLGISDNIALATSISSQDSRGENPRELSSSATGASHDVYWDSCTNAGASEFKDGTVQLQFTPNDGTNLTGNNGEPVDTALFTVDNRPEPIIVLNGDNCIFTKDTTPSFRAIMEDIRCGTKLYHRIRVWNQADALQFSKISAVDITGWDHEQASTEATDISFSGSTITRQTGSFIDDGWLTGQLVTVLGSTLNDATTRSADTVNALTMVCDGVFSAESAGETIRLSYWVDNTTSGVNPEWINGSNNIRYQVQAGDALSQDNNDPYAIKMEQAETRSRG